MLSNQDIVCFSPNPWDALWRNRQQIMSRLARQNRILFVEPTSYLRQISAGVRARGLGVIQRARLHSPLENLWVYVPPTYAPISGRAPLSNVTSSLRTRDLKQTMARLGMSDPILWIFQYNLGEMIGQLGECLAIYHAVDEYSAYELDDAGEAGREQRERIRRLEQELIRQVDLVFVTSPALYESKSKLHPHVVLVPNGVDYAHFANPDLNGYRPPELEPLSRPTIGYIGVINDKIDLQLLASVARRSPQWQFAFVGPILVRHDLAGLEALQALPNVHFIGSKPVDDLPAFARAFDVCLMPYKRNEWTRNISPLKLYEYLAAGTPIVSTELPATRVFGDTLWLASDPESFASAIAEALASDSPARRERQQAMARNHTWDQRVEALSAAIEARLLAVQPQTSE